MLAQKESLHLIDEIKLENFSFLRIYISRSASLPGYLHKEALENDYVHYLIRHNPFIIHVIADVHSKRLRKLILFNAFLLGRRDKVLKTMGMFLLRDYPSMDYWHAPFAEFMIEKEVVQEFRGFKLSLIVPTKKTELHKYFFFDKKNLKQSRATIERLVEPFYKDFIKEVRI